MWRPLGLDTWPPQPEPQGLPPETSRPLAGRKHLGRQAPPATALAAAASSASGGIRPSPLLLAGRPLLTPSTGLPPGAGLWAPWPQGDPCDGPQEACWPGALPALCTLQPQGQGGSERGGQRASRPPGPRTAPAAPLTRAPAPHPRAPLSREAHMLHLVTAIHLPGSAGHTGRVPGLGTTSRDPSPFPPPPPCQETRTSGPGAPSRTEPRTLWGRSPQQPVLTRKGRRPPHAPRRAAPRSRGGSGSGSRPPGPRRSRCGRGCWRTRPARARSAGPRSPAGTRTGSRSPGPGQGGRVSSCGAPGGHRPPTPSPGGQGGGHTLPCRCRRAGTALDSR